MTHEKPTLVCYSHPPISPGVQFIQTEMFDLIDVFRRKYKVFVVPRDMKTYEFYQTRYAAQFPDVTIIDVGQNYSAECYFPGQLEDAITRDVKHVDNVFVFSAGMNIVTPQAELKKCFDKFMNHEFDFQTDYSRPVKLPDPNYGQIMHEAEFLASVIKFKPKFRHRMVDYTEPRLDEVTGYPIKTLSYYATPSLKHHKLHDSELFYLLDRKEKVEKKWDFVFGWTVEVPERAYLSDFCFKHIQENAKVQLFVKDKHYSAYSPINTSLKSDTYYDLLRYAKFSLIAPSTNPEQLSLFRVYDDLAAYCMPIFMKNVQYWKGFEEKAVVDFIRDNLIYDEDKWPSFNEFLETKDYQKLYDELMSFDSMKKNSDKEWVYSQILEEFESDPIY